MQEGGRGEGGGGGGGPEGAHEGGHEGGPMSMSGGLPIPQSMAPGVPTPPTATPPQQQPQVDPYTQLINQILHQQMMQALGPYLNPQSSMPGYGSAFTPGQQTVPGATQMPQGGSTTGMPTPTAFLPGSTGQAAVAPNGGFTPGAPAPDTSQFFMPPSQVGASYNQGTAGSNMGWEQFLGMMNGGNSSLPNPSRNQLIGA